MSEPRTSYSVFGLHLRSNLPLPGLEPTLLSQPPDVQIRLCVSPSLAGNISAADETLLFTSSNFLSSGEPALRIWKTLEGRLLRLDYADGVQFWLDREGTAVWALWPDSSSLADAATYLLGPVLGLLLRLRGTTCLHASAVVIEDRAVAFAGDEGAGKSTLAAAFARRGHAVLSDDIVALEERDGCFHVMPAFPYLSLWADSVAMLYGPQKKLPPFSREFDKRMLLLPRESQSFCRQPLRLGAVFLLGEREGASACGLIEAPGLQESFVSLVANSYATHLLDTELRAREFAALGRLLAAVPVWRLRPSADPARLGELCESMVEACRRPQNRSSRAAQSS